MWPLCVSVRVSRHDPPASVPVCGQAALYPATLPHHPLEAHFLTGSEFSQLGYHLLKIGLSDGWEPSPTAVTWSGWEAGVAGWQGGGPKVPVPIIWGDNQTCRAWTTLWV